MKRKKTISTIALILLVAFSAIAISIPNSFARTPPREIPTWTYIGVSPEIVGINQEILIVFWCNELPPTANGAYGDRFTYYVDITTPEGTKTTIGPITSDPVGGGFVLYKPTSIGTYTAIARKEAIKLTGLPIPPGQTIDNIRGAIYVNDTLLASQSEPTTFKAQQQAIERYQETPLPTGYWSRPIHGANRGWASIAGNWLGGAAMNDGPTRNANPYSTGPESAHILWTRPYWEGGLMDGRFGSLQYYTGLSYENFGSPSVIMNGRIYYNVQTPPRVGLYCVDLYTGQTIYFQNTTEPATDISGSGGFDNSGGLTGGRIDFGQIFAYESPNQHGGFPYLWSTTTDTPRTWRMLDGFSGNYICSIANVTQTERRGTSTATTGATGTAVYGKDGSILRYNIVNLGTSSQPQRFLQVWNTTQAIWYEPVFSSNEYWMWRPDFDTVFDGRNGFSLNVSIPDVQGSIRSVREDQYVIGGEAGKANATYMEQGHLWALSLKPGEEGKLLWNITFNPPKQTASDYTIQSRGRVSLDTVDPENGVFTFDEGITRKAYVYSLTTGQLLWETPPEPQFNYYGVSQTIYRGKLLTYGYSGVLMAYDVLTGKVLWNWTAPDEGYQETFYPYSPLSMGVIADGKAYLYSTEHSPSVPLRRDANLWCVDTETGELLWKIQCWASGPKIADGRLITVDLFDNQLYCFGKSPSATTVSASPAVTDTGKSVMITGTVTEQGPGQTRHGIPAKGTPAIADEDQEAWMEYLYQQRPKPTDAKGVQVKLTAIDPNGNFQDIGTVTSDDTGFFSTAWMPPVPGSYVITANFEGSKSYDSSMARTAFAVSEAAAAQQTSTPAPTQTLAPTQPPAQDVSPTPPPSPAVIPPTSAMPTETYLAIGAAVVIIVVAAIALILKRRKQ